ncbi:hypothetical protein BWGOE4_55840 [Bacillus mycoides]|uniref:hypothetical protein n=1 Tax=Bacillus mycoides TaxID=1405 RepID=UPI0008730983|nr:hypothetical protein [Bacillus mycoides]OFD52860.1 hypothetical protein BWGOE4_55840 [Bacillus mycoides]OFD56108.1 hypothetical protein BWGOE7_56130 [Bacillus mycoides]OFD87192.1 hypothetical protein BWGOE12_57680 [Bacillus mycoides]
MNLQYRFSNNSEVQEYIEDMAYWIVEKSGCSMTEIEGLMVGEKEKVTNIFTPYPETALHHDPAKFAEMLAIHWNLVHEPKIVFV